MTSVASLFSLVLELPPSCIAFCPTQRDLFVVGTYFLHPDQNEVVINGERQVRQKRSGSLIVYRLNSESEDEHDKMSIKKLCAIKTESAVLDVQWSPHHTPGHATIAVATSNPMLEFYRLELGPDGRSADLKSCAWLRPLHGDDGTNADILALSLAWHPTDSKLMALTLSSGEVGYCETQGDFAEIGHSFSIRAPNELKHELEAWIAAFSPTSKGVFSGGDDCALRYFRPADAMEQVESSWQDKRLHDAGVTAILPLSDELVVTGSYDDRVRLIFAPQTGRRQVLAEKNLEGGVWRLKLVDPVDLAAMSNIVASTTRTCTILASCMHAGTRVLRLCKSDNGVWRFEMLAKFTEHKSMNYGSDVQPLLSDEVAHDATKMRTVVSTSFYDKLLCVWRFGMHESRVDEG